MAINEDTKLEELERIKGELRELLPLLSKWRVEELQKLISQHYTTKWKHHKFRKYGSINNRKCRFPHPRPARSWKSNL